jgi:hypothetical protein
MERKYMELSRPELSEGPKWANALADGLSQAVGLGMQMLASHVANKYSTPTPHPMPITGKTMQDKPKTQIEEFYDYFKSIENDEDKFWEQLEELDKVDPVSAKKVMDMLNVSFEEETQPQQ